MKISNINEILKYHVVDSTSGVVSTTPIFAGLETIVLGMSNEVSINARLLATGLSYIGFGSLIAKGRDIYRKRLNINDKTKERTQQIHDSLYGGLLNLLTTPLFYYASGARNLKEIIGGTLMGIGFGLAAGGLIGYIIDMGRDLTGIKESARVSEYIRNKNPRFKLSLAAAITAASIALTGAIYKLNSDNHAVNKQKAEQHENFKIK